MQYRHTRPDPAHQHQTGDGNDWDVDPLDRGLLVCMPVERIASRVRTLDRFAA